MSRTRLTALLVAVGLGAAGLAPASAAAPSRPSTHLADPGRALHAAVLDLAAGPDAARLAAWRGAYLAAAGDSAGAAEGPREFAQVYEVGDVDGDGHGDVAVQREQATSVRSGRDGRTLLRREGFAFLFGITGAGRVRLLSLDLHYDERDDGYAVTARFQGLDGKGRAVWAHEQTGAVSGQGVGPAWAGRLDSLPALFDLDQHDPDGRPALLLGSLTAVETPATVLSRMDLTTLSLTDGTAAPLSSVQGAGRGYAYAYPVPPAEGAGTCYASTAPTAALTRVQLACDGEEAMWTSVVRLRNPYVVEAGDFDGDRISDLQATTFGFERPRPRELLRGTQILSSTDGANLGTSRLDGLTPLRVDVDGDGQPDFLEFAFEEEGFAVQGVNLAGEVLYRSTLGLRSSGSLEGHLGMDVTGDGVPDAYLRAAPQKGEAVAVVVDGRTGRAQRTTGVDGMLWPGLRRTGIDLAVVTSDRGRLRTKVLSGDRGRLLLDVRVPGPAGTPAQGGAGTTDLDRDGRRDLVVASRSGNRHLTTAWSSAGRLLWQISEKAPPVREREGVVIVFG